MPVKHLNIWKKYLPEAVYVNVYGPTEITCNCTYHILTVSMNQEKIFRLENHFQMKRYFS